MGRWNRHKRWMNFILAFVVLLSGMCFGMEKANLDLCDTPIGTEAFRTIQKPPMRRNEHQTVQELSGMVSADMIQDDTKRTGKRERLKIDMIFAKPDGCTATHFYYQRMERQARQKERQGRTVIVRYIHRQDGKKDSAMYV